jgi:hypothetical protein
MKARDIEVGEEYIISRGYLYSFDRGLVLEVGIPFEYRSEGWGAKRRRIRLNNGVKIKFLDKVTGDPRINQEGNEIVHIFATRHVMRLWSEEDQMVRMHTVHAIRRKALESLGKAFATRIRMQTGLDVEVDARINLTDDDADYASITVCFNHETILDWILARPEHATVQAAIDGVENHDIDDLLELLGTARQRRQEREVS